MKILLDEQLAGLKPLLTVKGYEVSTAHEVGLAGKKDVDLINYAKTNDYIFITENNHAHGYAQSANLPCVWLSPKLKSDIIDKEIQNLSR